MQAFQRPLFSVAMLGALGLVSGTVQAANLPIASATATYDQLSPGAFPASQMIDGVLGGSNGWAIFRNTGAADDTHSETALFKLVSPLAAGPQVLTFSIVQLYPDPFHVLGNFSLAYTAAAVPTLGSAQTGVGITSALSTVAGTVLSTSGGTVSVTGTLQTTDIYTITATINSAAPVTGFFLNAIDTNGDTVAGGGPGRQPNNGNFVVTEFTVSAVPEPAAWALMWGGLAGVARWAGKRRR